MTDTDITPVYVRFGPRPTQEMPIDWAEKMLSELKAKHAPLFGKLLTAATDDDLWALSAR